MITDQKTDIGLHLYSSLVLSIQDRKKLVESMTIFERADFYTALKQRARWENFTTSIILFSLGATVSLLNLKLEQLPLVHIHPNLTGIAEVLYGVIVGCYTAMRFHRTSKALMRWRIIIE
jgi:hypothetical protein